MKFPRADIIQHRVTRHVIQRDAFRHIARGFADHYGKLHFPIGLFHVARNLHHRPGSDNGACGLHEYARHFKLWAAHFLGVITIIAPNTQNLAGHQRCQALGPCKRLPQRSVLWPRGKGNRTARSGHCGLIAEQRDHIGRDDLGVAIGLSRRAHSCG